MRKIWVIATREYLAATKAKAFIVTLLLMPVLMMVSVGLQLLFKKLEDAKEKTYAVIDRTKGQNLAAYLKQAEASLLMAQSLLPDMGELNAFGKLSFDVIKPSPADPDAISQQRFEISKEIEKGKYDGLVEIGPNVFETHKMNLLKGEILPKLEKINDDAAVRFQTKNVSALQVRKLIELLLNQGVQKERLKAKGITSEDIALAQQPVAFKTKSLTRADNAGKFVDAADETAIVNLLLPAALLGLMFMIIVIGAAPAMHGVIEEKSQRIAEVLLGSVPPFQLMAGKLLGVVGVALTLAMVYLGGGFCVLTYFGWGHLLPPSLLAWFFLMLILALLSYGSLFIAVGAAAADIKDTQTLLMPVMMIACLPFFALGPIMQDPQGPIARFCSFFPFATPMLMVARESVPPGVPLWEMILGVTLVLATTLVCVWAAGRIFRVGILMQGKPPRFYDLLRWAIRG